MQILDIFVLGFISFRERVTVHVGKFLRTSPIGANLLAAVVAQRWCS